MSLILSIETATATCSVALHNAGHLVAHTALVSSRSHAECLMVMIENLLKTSQYDRKALAAIAISSGPGSYTGLRIGATVGKGLCYGLDIPLIAIPTLVAMVHGIVPFIDTDTLLCPAIDARRNAIYTLIADKTGQIKRDTHVALLDNNGYRDTLPKQTLLFFGDGALKCKKLLKEYNHIHYLADIVPSALHIGSLAFVKFQQQLWENRDGYTPYYLSQFQEK